MAEPPTDAKYTAPKYQQNSHGRYDCPEPGCEHKGKNGFEHPQGVGRHRWAKHRTPPVTTLAKANGHGPKIAAKVKRPREVLIDRPARIAAHVNGNATIVEALSYCPRCGDDLSKIVDVTGVTPHKCPGCKLNLSSVAEALAPDMLRLDASTVTRVFSTIKAVAGRVHS
jgi:hypothetical protein